MNWILKVDGVCDNIGVGGMHMSSRKNKKKMSAKSATNRAAAANFIFYFGGVMLGFGDMPENFTIGLPAMAIGLFMAATTYPMALKRNLTGFKTWATVSASILAMALLFSLFAWEGFVDYIGLVGSFGIIGTAGQALVLFMMRSVGKLSGGTDAVVFKTDSKDSGVKNLLAQGRANIAHLDELYAKIPTGRSPITKQFHHIRKVSVQIFEYIAQKPHLASRTGTLMDYYFPTVFKLLENYAQYNSKKVKSVSVREIMQGIAESLTSASTAFGHQLDNLYSDKMLDLKTDLVVLEQIMKQQNP